MPALALGMAFLNLKEKGIAENPSFIGFLPEKAFYSLDQGLRAGLRAIDTALVYRTHSAIRQVLGEWFRRGDLQRKDLFITTKVYQPDSTIDTSNTSTRAATLTPAQVTDRVTAHVETCLEDLSLGYLDLVLLHWPSKPGDDNAAMNRKRRIAAWKVLEGFYQRGWIRAIGVSNFSETHLKQLVEDGATVTPAVNQIEASVLLQWRDIMQYCQEQGIQVQAFSPLGMGDANVIENPVVQPIAGKLKRDAGQVALRYLIQKGYAVVFNSSSPKRLVSNQEIFNMELSPQDMAALDGLNVGVTESPTGLDSPYSLS